MIKITKKLIRIDKRALMLSTDGYYTNGEWAIKIENAVLDKNVKISDRHPTIEKIVNIPNLTKLLKFSQILPGENKRRIYVSECETYRLCLDDFYCKKLKIGNEIKTEISEANFYGYMTTPVIYNGVILMSCTGHQATN